MDEEFIVICRMHYGEENKAVACNFFLSLADARVLLELEELPLIQARPKPSSSIPPLRPQAAEPQE